MLLTGEEKTCKKPSSPGPNQPDGDILESSAAPSLPSHLNFLPWCLDRLGGTRNVAVMFTRDRMTHLDSQHRSSQGLQSFKSVSQQNNLYFGLFFSWYGVPAGT